MLAFGALAVREALVGLDLPPRSTFRTMITLETLFWLFSASIVLVVQKAKKDSAPSSSNRHSVKFEGRNHENLQKSNPKVLPLSLS